QLLVWRTSLRRMTVIDLEKKTVSKQVRVGKSPHGVWTLNHAPAR
ncbi:YVTN family beta-propeller repeat protein, partial [Bordetella hinzii]